MKTARFTKVVAKSGKPRVHVSWTAQEKDQELKRALKENRVMSVHAETKGGGKSFGTVGLHAEVGTQIFIFPKSVRAFQDEKIVGINFDLLADADEENPTTFAKKAPVADIKKSKTVQKPVIKKLPELPPVKSKPEPEKIARVEKPVRVKLPETLPTRKTAISHPVVVPSLADVMAEVSRAAKELKSGKAVAAYARLEKILAAAKPKASS